MSETTSSPSLSERIGAWQPLTGGGIAAFARAGFGRLFGFQLLFALVGGATLVLAFRLAWVPAIENALGRLPEAGAEIRHGRLQWPGTNSVLLGESPQFAIGVTPSEGAILGLNNDILLDLRPGWLRLRGLFGFADLPYPEGMEVPLTLTGGRAAWDAWRAPLAGSVVLAGALVQGVAWWLLVLIYVLPAWTLAALLGHSPGGRGMLRVCAAALLPVTVLLWVTILLYAARFIPAPGLAAGLGLWLVAGWLWLGWAVLALPSTRKVAQPTNPFTSGDGGKKGGVKAGKKGNPFG